MEARGSGLFIVLVILVGAAGATLWAEDRAQRRRQPHAEEFQRLVGGVGFGPAVDLSVCPFSFDPRLEGSCAQDGGPIAGGACFCPRHAGSIFFYPPLDHQRPPHEAEDGRAPVP